MYPLTEPSSHFVCPWRFPKVLADLRGDASEDVAGDVLVALGEHRIGPAHDLHRRPVRHTQLPQDSGRCVPSIVGTWVSHAARPRCPPAPLGARRPEILRSSEVALTSHDRDASFQAPTFAGAVSSA